MSAARAFALILAGGGGTRLWPASRRARPKQLLALGGPESLLGAAVRRAIVLFGPEHTLIVTAADQAAAIREAAPALPPENIVVEPAPRNTAAAVGLGAVHAVRRAGDDVVLAMLPADAYIGDEDAFAAVVRAAVAAASAAVVTIGLRPTHPETGFGYLAVGARVAGDMELFEVARFVEKPSAEHAASYVASGYLWNSGTFFFTAARLFAETRRHLPELSRALDAFRAAPDLRASVAALYPSLPAISIDYGIMEKASGIRVVPGSCGWNDLGSWAALSAIRPSDAAGNVLIGDALARDVNRSVIVAEVGAPLVAAVGVDDLVVVATHDAVLVVKKDRAQEVRRIVDALAAEGRQDLL